MWWYPDPHNYLLYGENMSKKYLLIFISLTIFSPSIVFCSNVKSFKIHDDFGGVFIYYNPKIAFIINKDITDYQGSQFFTVQVAEVYLSEQNKEKLIIEYCEGGSADPGFAIYMEQKAQFKRVSEYISGTNILISGDGKIYVWGHTNSFFNLRRVFYFFKNRIIEIEQPYYYVGLKSKILIIMPFG